MLFRSLLPIATGYENSGSFINISGTLQSFDSIVSQKGETKYGWTIICDIANKFELSGFNYKNRNEILNEFKTLCQDITKPVWTQMSIENTSSSIKDEIIIIPEICYLSTDPLIRRAKSLQSSKTHVQNETIKCNSNTYKKIKDSTIIDVEKNIDIIIENNISDNCIIINKNCHLYETLSPYSSFSNVTNKP